MRLLIPFHYLVFLALFTELGFQFFLYHLLHKKRFWFWFTGTTSTFLTIITISLLYFSWIKVLRPDSPVAYVSFSKITPYVILVLMTKTLVFIFYIAEKLTFFVSFTTKSTRLIWISKTGLFISAVLAIFILYSAHFTPFQLQVIRSSVSSPALPGSFQNFKIVQISDTHFGTFKPNQKLFSTLVDSVNALHPDLIVFTGDFVNNFAEEMKPYVHIFSKLNASSGKIAVLGNHDHGDYKKWNTTAQKTENTKRLNQYIAEMGFQLLNNKNICINHWTDSIYIAGIDNWGKPPLKQYGRLELATKNIPADGFIVLLSHNPDLWKAKVLDDPRIKLTLAGHTHGLQMGIRSDRVNFSPAKYIYPYWGGLYSENGQYLYVNVGVGCLGMTARFGLTPEISLISLHQ